MRRRFVLADDALHGADDERDGVGPLAERLQAPGDAVGVTTRLVKMGLQHGAVGPARGHRDLRLQEGDGRTARWRAPR